MTSAPQPTEAQKTAKDGILMKAIVYEKYGSPDVLELKDIDRPIVGEDDVLVRVRAVSINPYDWHFMRGKPYFMRLIAGLRRPKLKGLGVDLAGEVEAVGANVTQFQRGDEVLGRGDGALAEYVCTPEGTLVKKPANLTFEQAAAVYMGATTALQGLRDKGNVQPGQKVLVNGASGGVGTFAVQLAKWFGAEVTGVCSTRNVEMVHSIGADHVIDYTQEDFTRSGQRYDVLFDNMANRSFSEYARIMAPNGVHVLAGGPVGGSLLGPVPKILGLVIRSRFSRRSVAVLNAKLDGDDLPFLRERLEAGEVTPVIDRTYPLSETAEAMRYLEEGHAQGKVVITV